MEYIIIEDIIKSGNRIDIDFSISKGLDVYFAKEHHFFVEYDCDVSGVPDSIAVVPLLANLIPFSMIVDAIVWVKEVDMAFYDMIPKLKNAFREMYHRYNFGGTLIAARIICNSYNSKNEVVQCFTGGVDATTSFYRQGDNEITLFNVNGGYRSDICASKVFDADKCAINEFAYLNNAKTVFARSNFRTFICSAELDAKYYRRIGDDWWHGFQHSLAFLGAASVAGYVIRAKEIWIASSYTIGQEAFCASDPRTDNCFACASLHAVHDGYELDRQEKISFLVKKQKENAKEIKLRVCVFNDHNCGKCEKCLRTMAAIAAEGGNWRDFGFTGSQSLYARVDNLLNSNVLSLSGHALPLWKSIVSRMQVNIELIDKDCKDTLNLLKEYPMERSINKARLKYYCSNFVGLAITKIKAIIRRR